MGRVLELHGLTTHIRSGRDTLQAVDGVSFWVEAGETVGLVGESGCGKSMVANSIMRLLPSGGRIVDGEVLLDGVDLTGLSELEMRAVRGNDIGMIFQDPMTSLNPTMTIGRQIAESVETHRMASRKEALERAAEVLALVGMPQPRERLEDYPHQLSGGLRQRVMIAMALACEPRLLIADEPTTALDVSIQAQILSLIDDLKDRLGMAVMLITHDIGVIAGRADHTVVMYAGRVVEEADTSELFARMRHPYTEALLASVPQRDQDPSRLLYSIPGIPPDLARPGVGCRFAPRCRYAEERCRVEDPHLGGANPNHPYACFHPTSTDASDLGHSSRLFVSSRTDSARLRPGQSSDILLEVSGVSKEYPVTAHGVWDRKVGSLQAVTDLSLQLRAGETFGLVGESGCGKSTTGRMIVGLETPTAGRIDFDGRDLATLKGRQLRRVRRDLQLMFQDPYASLDPRMRVGPIIEEPLDIQGQGPRSARRHRVRELLDQVGLPLNALERFPYEFSGGQRQRIGLARALALSPKLIVADEPVSALDVSIRSQILNLMKRLQDEYRLTYLIISHDLSVVRYMADRVGVMYLGQLVELGTAEDIYDRPAHPYTAGLLASVPVADPDLARSQRGAAISGELPSPIHPPSGCRFRTRCPRAEAVCAAQEPQLVSFGGEHQARCHFPLWAPDGEAHAPSPDAGSASKGS